VLFHYFDQFLAEYESRFQGEYGFLRHIIKEVVEKYLDCGNPRCGFARVRCPDCGSEFLLHFSCRSRGFCPSCHAKRLEEWGEWMREELLLDVPHRQVVFTIPKMLRIFFKYNRRLLGDLCRLALRSLTLYFKAMAGSALMAGVIAAIQTFGDRINSTRISISWSPRERKINSLDTLFSDCILFDCEASFLSFGNGILT
jgi:ribosomal protein S27E